MSPRLLSLPEAVHEIVDATRIRPWQAQQSTPWARYFFIVGAGISYPSIPLAGGIEALCRKQILEQGGTPPTSNGSAMERYEATFQAAFPHPEDRRAFLHHHIKSAPISAANFRLAHLVSAGKPSNLVVTTNFDELFTKALRLFGKDVIVCDHPKTTQRIDPKRDDPQVIHVHGTHWFYDCCNLKEEIENRAEADREENTSMSHLLDRILFDRSPLVVGYSGWEGDVVMAALKRRLKLPLSYNLYWFCFRRADVDTLPRWLKEHGNVRFVVPPTPPVDMGDGVKASPSGVGQSARVVPTPTGTPGDSGPKEPVLAARQVFDALIQGLKLEEPRLTKDPLDFFADQLLVNLVAPDVSDEDDIYLIRSVIRRVKDGAVLARQEMERRSQKAKEATALFDKVSRAVRGALYSEAVDAAGGIELANLTEAQRLELDNALETIYQSTADSEAMTGLQACKMRIRLCDVARDQDDKDPSWLLRQAKAIHGKGYCLAELGSRTEAIAAYDEVVQRFGGAAELGLKERVAQALVNKGLELSKEDKAVEAIAAWDEVVQRFGDAAEFALQDRVARSLVYKGFDLSSVKRRAEVIVVCDEVVRRFGEAADVSLRERVAQAFVLKGFALEEEDKKAEAILIWDEVVRRFGEATEIDLKQQVAWAYLAKGRVWGEEGKKAEAIAACDEVVRRFGQSIELELKDLVARALLNKGHELSEEGKRAEAITSWDEIVRRFGEVAEPSLKEWVARALLSKGHELSEEGKKAEAILVWDEIVRRFGEASETVLRQQVAWAYISKGSVLGEEGKRAEAIAACDEVVRRFGQSVELELKDLVARALLNKGHELSEEGKRAEAITSWDEIVRRFGEAVEPSLKEWVARALLNKGGGLGKEGKRDEAIAAYDEIVRRFSEASGVDLQLCVAKALVNKGAELGREGKGADAIATASEVVRLFGEAVESGLQEQVAFALINKGHVHNAEGNRTDAVAVWNEIVRRWGGAAKSSLKELADQARMELARVSSRS